MVTNRIRGGTGTNPNRSSGDLPDQTAEEPSDPPAPHRSNHVAQETSDPPVPHRSNHVDQETSDPPAPHRSKARNLPRDDQPNPHSVAESNAAVELGPWGGNGGNSWDDGADFDGIRQIKVYYGHCIDAIQVVYVNKDGTLDPGSKHGGTGGIQTKFDLHQDEYIVAVTGHYGEFQGPTVLRSLKFTTNKRSFGPLGSEEGTAFVLPVVDGRIIGFFGCSGKYVDSIGVHIVSN